MSEHPIPLPSRLATGELARASVTAVLRAAGLDRTSTLDADRIALAYRSDRVFRIDGTMPEVWSPYSGFWRSADGWMRTHGNYPHHARALLCGLGLPDDAGAPDVGSIIAGAAGSDSVGRITAAGGLAVVVGAEDPAIDAELRARPLVEISRTGDDEAPPAAARPSDHDAPLRGIRVLDLTRVIAGPVCTRTLALLGADVLRIDPPHLPEPVWQHLDTGHGKRSAILDARSPGLQTLLAGADVVVLGYRPAAIERLGLSPDALTERHPGLIVAQLSAWGAEHPDRAGFDSLVQAESGIAMVESPDGETPGVLPAQALDHSAGYLLAAGVIDAVRRRRDEGGGWHVSTSLRRVAAELLGMPRRSQPAPAAEIDPAPHTQEFTVGGRIVTTARAAIPGFSFAAPRAWATDAPQW
ncbi:CoA transferase [Microbacterium tenebrionis]|uniref:CoA transferase n=1 Tax=Microbacterium tenebrionis TaxID=2830665 RepID=UPI00158C8E07|nr:CoA transferase [Microbacterium ihumii]